MPLSNTKKIKVGSTEKWIWVAPQPVVSTTLNVSFTTANPAWSAQVALTRVGAPLVVTGLAPDQRTLSFSIPPINPEGLAGPGFLRTRTGKVFAVKIEQITELGTAILEEPISEIILFDSNWQGELEFASWYADLDTVANIPRKNMNWQVFFETGDNEVPDTEIVDSGIVQVVRRPFTTGLSHEKLLGYFPYLIQRMPDRQGSLAPQIEAAENELVNLIRGEVRAKGWNEDNIEGSYFESAHAYLTASLVLFGDLETFEQAESLRGIFKSSFKETLQRVLVDTSEDGTTDSDTGFGGGYGGSTTSSFIQGCPPRRKFRIGGPR